MLCTACEHSFSMGASDTWPIACNTSQANLQRTANKYGSNTDLPPTTASTGHKQQNRCQSHVAYTALPQPGHQLSRTVSRLVIRTRFFDDAILVATGSLAAHKALEPLLQHVHEHGMVCKQVGVQLSTVSGALVNLGHTCMCTWFMMLWSQSP